MGIEADVATINLWEDIIHTNLQPEAMFFSGFLRAPFIVLCMLQYSEEVVGQLSLNIRL
jgi:hypothetical protein